MDKKSIVLCGNQLTLEDIVSVARYRHNVCLTTDENVKYKMDTSVDVIADIVKKNIPLYGVTTLFGGLAMNTISGDLTEELQHNLVLAHHTGAGSTLPLETVRAAMVLRANTHLIGSSGIRRIWAERLILFLTNNVVPLVPEFGSIGASGDLVPLSYIASALAGNDERIFVNFDGEILSAPQALAKLNIESLNFAPKEALALLNGTSAMSGSAALATYDLYTIMAATLHIHALAIQALAGCNQSFHPFLHQVKPHPGQIDAASIILDLLDGSTMIYDCFDAPLTQRSVEHLIQDRYSIRCLPQFLGPILETLYDITRTLEIEFNSANDNPLIDINTRKVYCGGNFLGEHVSISMDRLRNCVGLMAKHLDVQMAQIVTPEFSNGLPPCLIGNRDRPVNIGLKALQLCGNSIMPYLLFLGQSMADKFPTHAEQYNQNINSMGFMSAQIARQSIDIMRQYIAICFLFVIQAVDLRAKMDKNTYDPSSFLSKATLQTYEAVRNIIQVDIDPSRPYLWNDGERLIDSDIIKIANSLIDEKGLLLNSALRPTIEYLHNKRKQNHHSSQISGFNHSSGHVLENHN
jgi:phenylalanine ammonia-lyase